MGWGGVLWKAQHRPGQAFAAAASSPAGIRRVDAAPCSACRADSGVPRSPLAGVRGDLSPRSVQSAASSISGGPQADGWRLEPNAAAAAAATEIAAAAAAAAATAAAAAAAAGTAIGPAGTPQAGGAGGRIPTVLSFNHLQSSAEAVVEGGLVAADGGPGASRGPARPALCLQTCPAGMSAADTEPEPARCRLAVAGGEEEGAVGAPQAGQEDAAEVVGGTAGEEAGGAAPPLPWMPTLGDLQLLDASVAGRWGQRRDGALQQHAAAAVALLLWWCMRHASIPCSPSVPRLLAPTLPRPRTTPRPQPGDDEWRLPDGSVSGTGGPPPAARPALVPASYPNRVHASLLRESTYRKLSAETNFAAFYFLQVGLPVGDEWVVAWAG